MRVLEQDIHEIMVNGKKVKFERYELNNFFADGKYRTGLKICYLLAVSAKLVCFKLIPEYDDIGVSLSRYSACNSESFFKNFKSLYDFSEVYKCCDSDIWYLEILHNNIEVKIFGTFDDSVIRVSFYEKDNLDIVPFLLDLEKKSHEYSWDNKL